MKNNLRIGCLGVIIFYTVVFIIFAATSKDFPDDFYTGYVVTILIFLAIYRIFLRKKKELNWEVGSIVESKKNAIKTQIEEFDCMVSGSQFESKNGVPRESYIEDMHPYENLDLQLEEDNEFDENAVLVLYDGNDIGYIPKRFSAKVSNYLKGGYEVEAFVKKTYKKEQHINCVMIIEVFENK